MIKFHFQVFIQLVRTAHVKIFHVFNTLILKEGSAIVVSEEGAGKG